MTYGVGGSLTVGINKDHKATEIVVLLQANTSDYTLLQQTNVCVSQQDPYRGLIIYVRLYPYLSTLVLKTHADAWGFIRISISQLQYPTPIPLEIVLICRAGTHHLPTSIHATV